MKSMKFHTIINIFFEMFFSKDIQPSKSKDPTKDVLCRSGPKKYIRRETIEMSRFHVPRNHGNVEIPRAEDI